MFRKILAVILLLFTLVGCNKQSYKDYFIKHPQAIKKTLLYCQEMQINSDIEEQPNCVAALYVNDLIISFSQEMFSDSQMFGNKILHLQMKSAKLQSEIKKQKEDIQSLTANNEPNKTKIAKGNFRLEKLENQYKDLNYRVKIMLMLVSKAEEMILAHQ